MDYTRLGKEELIKIINDLRNAYEGLREFYERDEQLFRKAEEERRLSEEKFRKAFHTSPDSININRLADGLYVSVNNGFLEMLGYSEEEVLGKTSIELNIWVDPQRRNILVKLLQEEGKAENFEARFRRRDGSIITGLMSASLIEIGGVPHLLNVTRDISRLKETEQMLHEERNLLRTLIDNMPDRIYAKDKNSRFTVCNSALVKRMGKSKSSEVIGKSDFDLLPRELAEQFYKDEQEIIRSGTPLIDHEESMGSIAGKVRWNMTTKVPVRDSAGNITGIVGIGRDITDRKRRENEAKALFEIIRGVTVTSNLDELLSLIHNALSEVVYAENFFVALHDTETGLFSFPYFVDKYDTVPPPMALAKSCTAYVFRTVRPFLLNRTNFNDLLAAGEVEQVGTPSPSWIGIPLQIPSRVTGVMVLQHYESELVYSEDDLSFLTSIAGQIAIAIERKKFEDELKVKNNQLLLLNAEKDKFFSIIAHDLRGPLSAFVAATQILAEEINNISIEEIKDLTVSMKNDASSVYGLLENLLEWSRLQRGVIEFSPEKLKLADLAGKAVQPVLPSSTKKNINLINAVDTTATVYADRHMTETVLRNLLSNAVKFTPARGHIKISSSSSGDGYAEIEVSDTGIGMDKQLVSRLFMVNEKTSRPGTDGEPSSGLGLLLCKEFIEKNNGSVKVESEPGKGSRFIIRLHEDEKH